MLSTDMEAIKKKKKDPNEISGSGVWDTLGGVDGRLDNAEERAG